jgi:hypothetical protein
MKLGLILVVVFGLLAALALGSYAAGPYIVADPQADASTYRMRLSPDGGATWGDWVEGPPVNGGMKFDLEAVPRGTYQGEAEAGGTVEVTDKVTQETSSVTAWSDPAPFELRVKPGIPVVHIKATKD